VGVASVEPVRPVDGMMRDMRAVVVSRSGGPEVLELDERPSPAPAPGEVLVDVTAAGVNFMDIYGREGRAPYGRQTPFVLGAEGAGTVAALGDGVSALSVGHTVAWTGVPGSYAEQVVVPADKAVPVPAGVDATVAAAVMLQGCTAHYLAASTFPVSEGDVAVVHAAAGGVGLLLTQIVRLRGGHVLGTTSTEAKAELAREAGADEVVRYEGFAERAKEVSGGGVAAVYDGVGQPTFLQGFEALRPRGVVVLFGAAGGPPDPLDLRRLSAGSFYVTRPSLAGYTRTTEELRERAATVLGWVADGKLDVRVGQRYDLADARRAHEDLEGRRTTGKLLLVP
jgi:NADPH2:quinone reductase